MVIIYNYIFHLESIIENVGVFYFQFSSKWLSLIHKEVPDFCILLALYSATLYQLSIGSKRVFISLSFILPHHSQRQFYLAFQCL